MGLELYLQVFFLGKSVIGRYLVGESQRHACIALQIAILTEFCGALS